jgi:hypothetical protein
MTSTFTKDSSAVLDYQWDWSAWLAAGETIASAVITVPTGIVKDSQTATTTAVTAWLSGGTVGTRYALTCHIVTNQGRQDDRTIKVNVQER